MTPFATVQATFVATLVDEWVRNGVRHAIVSPGSRSTPLVLALADDDRIAVHVHLDERSAAFFALGIGLAGGTPAVVLTTSGTATTHLHAAMVEAHQSRVPLIACTADRPPALHHVGAPQTIEQANLFVGATRWTADVGVAREGASGTWRSIAARAVAEATTGRLGPGPVHLNLAFDDPLVGEAGPLPEGRSHGRPWHEVLPLRGGDAGLDDRLVGRRGVIVAGGGAGSPAAVHALAARLGWPVLADPRSRCRGRRTSVAAFDPILRAGAPAPEVVVRLGQLPASKVLAQWLSTLEAVQLVVDPHGAWPDPDRTASTVVAADPTAWCARTALDAHPADAWWLGWWQEAEHGAQLAIDELLGAQTSLTEPAVARTLTEVVPAGGTLLVASSMPVRDAEWFGSPRAAQRVLSNRGANGIDGLVATSLGVAAASPGPVVAHLGDLSFLHDSGSLLGAAHRGVDCTFVVVDNDGGGIFSFLPQAASLAGERFERFFGTPHGIDLAALAAVHGIGCTAAATASELAGAVRTAMASGGVQLVLVRTDRATNVVVHDQLNQAVAGRAVELPTAAPPAAG